MRALLSIVVVAALAGSAAAGQVSHVPPAEADAGRPLQLAATVARAWDATLVVRFRPVGGGGFQTAEFQRAGEQWLAVIPADQVRAPGLEYYLEAQLADAEVAEFASADRPHVVAVWQSDDDLRRARELGARHGRRSRLGASFDYVDLGSREVMVGGARQEVPDRYWRVDADWTFHVLRYPLKAFRIGYTRLDGLTPDPDGGAACPPAGPDCRGGFKVGGWFELRFAFVDGIELDTRGAAMATTDGVSLGGKTELRIGVEDGSHVAFGGELLADVGASGYVRLGWATVPGLPMAATVETSNYPTSDRDYAVRLLYDIAHPFPGGLRLGARVGYQARDERVGGLTLGLRGAVDF